MFNAIDIVIYLVIAAIINRIIMNNNNVVFDNNVYDKHYYNDLSNDLSYMEIMNINHTMDDNLCNVQNIYGYNNQSIKIIIPDNIVVVM
jgi:hypothetical protein